MDKIIEEQLNRMEAALKSLTDSIAGYNPSITAANALLQAESDLQDGLKQLVQHQRNFTRMTALQNTIAQQNESITAQVTTLAELRTELLSIPSSLPQDGRRDVTAKEVLAYAKHIARFSAPPNFRPKSASAAAVKVEGADGKSKVEKADVKEEGKDGGDQPVEGRGLADLQEEEKQWLDPWTGVQFTPWPGEDVIKRGALGHIQAMVENGVDPASVVSMGPQEESRVEEIPVTAGEDSHRQAQPRAPREEPKVFGGLDLYDPDEE